jgi:uncharacterized membrane protein
VIFLLAFVLGIVSGLRAFTAPAVLVLLRGNRIAGIVLAVLAVGEIVMDLLPSTPSRTSPGPLAARVVSGAFVGWFIMGAAPTATHVGGAILGALGALAGTYGGHALRLKAITAIGAVPAAILEDVIAIGLAIATVLAVANVA